MQKPHTVWCGVFGLHEWFEQLVLVVGSHWFLEPCGVFEHCGYLVSDPFECVFNGYIFVY